MSSVIDQPNTVMNLVNRQTAMNKVRIDKSLLSTFDEADMTEAGM